MAQIDTPHLECLKVDYLDEHDGFEFQIPQLCKFINRTEIFKQHQFRSADLCFEDYTVTLELDEGWMFRISILEEWISEILGQNFDMFSNVDRLYIFARFAGVGPEDIVLGEGTRWLELLRLFTAVQALSVEDTLSHHVVLALNGSTGESAAEVLPALELLCLENEEVTRVQDFVAFRRNMGRPLTFINSPTEFEKRLGLNISDS